MAQWEQVFERFGGSLEVPELGCCGMCGAFGHERRHREESRGVFDMSWGRRLPRSPADQAQILATGHSCRSQVKRFGGFRPNHPLEILAAKLGQVVEPGGAEHGPKSE